MRENRYFFCFIFALGRERIHTLVSSRASLRSNRSCAAESFTFTIIQAFPYVIHGYGHDL